MNNLIAKKGRFLTFKKLRGVKKDEIAFDIDAAFYLTKARYNYNINNCRPNN